MKILVRISWSILPGEGVWQQTLVNGVPIRRDSLLYTAWPDRAVLAWWESIFPFLEEAGDDVKAILQAE